MARKVENHYIYLTVITACFLFTRLLRLDSVPFTSWGMHIDELGAAYDAWCIQGWGVDRHLIHMPVYFYNTGIGQSALYTYTAAIIFKFFGFSLFKYRIVAVIYAFIAFVCLYFLSRLIYGKSLHALIPISLMTVMPVFMMSEHWGLDCYLFLSMSIVSMSSLVYAVMEEKIRILRCLAYFGA